MADTLLNQELARGVFAAAISTTPILGFGASVQPLDRNLLLPIGAAIDGGEPDPYRHRDGPVPAVGAGSPVAQLRMFVSPPAKALAVSIQVQPPPGGAKRTAAHKLLAHPMCRIPAHPRPRGRGSECDEGVREQDLLKGAERALGSLSPPARRNCVDGGIDREAHELDDEPC